MRVRSVVAVLGSAARAAAFVVQPQPAWLARGGLLRRASSATTVDLFASAGSDLLKVVPPVTAVTAAATKPGGLQIFCNRELALRRIEAIGFDMDYTLAQYLPAFDLLAYEGSQAKLVAMGYPAELLTMSYEPEKFSRGLVLDKQRGNILKMDRYKYVRVAQHGSKRLNREARRAVYTEQLDQQPTYTGASYVNLDTQFQVVDANLFAQLVDLKDQYAAASKDAAATSSITANSALFLASKSYADLFKDIRRCVDLCHRDGIIKDQVALDPAKYIVPDPNLFPMLQQFQLSGKKVFLLTNSFYDYTDVAMTFLLQEHRKAQAMAAAVTGDSIRDPEPSSWAARGEWVQYFDLVVVGSCKPAYMLDPYLSMFRVETPADVAAASAAAVAGAGDELPRGAMSPPLSDRGYCGGSEYWLRNTDGVGLDPDAFLAQGRVFQGGNWQHLHDMLGVAQGDQVLYVGDHTYSDILRSKRTLGWRTCLVIPELERELNAYADPESKRRYLELQRLKALQRAADDAVDAVSLRLYRLAAQDVERAGGIKQYSSEDDDDDDEVAESGAEEDGGSEGAAEGGGEEAGDAAIMERECEAEALADVLKTQGELKGQVLAATEALHSLFHQEWGQLFKAGQMDSRFAKQVAEYACIYATRASDLGGVSPTRDFRPADDLLPHDVHGRSGWQLEDDDGAL